MGRNLVFPPNGITGPEWTLVYTSSTLIGAIVGGSIAASVIITVLIVAVTLIIVIFILKKRPIAHEGNAVIPMSTNMVYHGNTSQDNILLHQLNPAYINGSDIHIYDEIQYEEIPAVQETNLHNNNDDDANQVNQEDQDNGSYVSQVDQEDQDSASYVSQENQDDQDTEDSECYVYREVIDDVAQSQEDKGSYENIPKVDNDDYIC